MSNKSTVFYNVEFCEPGVNQPRVLLIFQGAYRGFVYKILLDNK